MLDIRLRRNRAQKRNEPRFLLFGVVHIESLCRCEEAPIQRGMNSMRSFSNNLAHFGDVVEATHLFTTNIHKEGDK